MFPASQRLRLSGNLEDAADITQEVFLALLLKPPKPGFVQSPRGYLAFRTVTLARRLERSRVRRRRRESRAAKNILETSLADSQDAEAVRVAIRELPEKLRAVVELRYLGDLRNREIAALLGFSERGVEEQLRRALDKLRARLGSSSLSLLLVPRESSSGEADVPPELLADLIRVVRFGRALAPLTATAVSGGLMLKKLVLGALAAILLLGFVTWMIENDDTGEKKDQMPDGSTPVSVSDSEETTVESVVVSPVVTDEPKQEDQNPAQRNFVEHRVHISGYVVDSDGIGIAEARVLAFTSPGQIHRL